MRTKLKLLACLLVFAPAPVIANPSDMEVECYAAVMEAAIRSRRVVVASSVATYCGCYVNNQRQGLSVRSCPRWKSSEEYEYNQIFR